MESGSSDLIDVNVVLQYVQELKHFYDELSEMNHLQLYDYFLTSEEHYICKKKICFASSVHILWPQNFLQESDLLSW